jgi:heme/copper-type cytochrome/quinol oxidase subunit 3
MSAAVESPRSATTGEPVATVARRNRLGIWLCIISDATGTVALLISYVYLWSLNVNNQWAPPKNAFADWWPFWAIVAGIVMSTALIWWGIAGIAKGHKGRLAGAAVLASLILIATLVGQIVQLSTFPFGPSDGAYASATFWLCLATAFHLSLLGLLVLAISLRTAKGLITTDNHSHARLVAMYMTWVCISAALGALVATTMLASPNTQMPLFGTFTG